MMITVLIIFIHILYLFLDMIYGLAIHLTYQYIYPI